MKKILIIGESCLDIWLYCKAERLAPDFPVPVVQVLERQENPGMAKNVERNLNSIGVSCDITTNKNWREVTKTRYVHRDSNHAFFRVDAEHDIERVDVSKISLDKYDIIVISDYDKGFLTKEDISYICEHHDMVFVDTKKILGPWAMKARYIKINNFEYERSKDIMPPALIEKIIYTKGASGAIFQGKAYPVERPVEVRDTSGAGDSFFAALIAKYAETEDIQEAISFANKCASEVVSHRGVTTISNSDKTASSHAKKKK